MILAALALAWGAQALAGIRGGEGGGDATDPGSGEYFAVSPHPFNVSISMEDPALNFALTPSAGGQALNLRPPTAFELGIALHYRALGGRLLLDLPQTGQVKSQEGGADYNDYRVGYFARSWGVQLHYVSYTGFLVDNSSVLPAADLGGGTYFLDPGMHVWGFGADATYIFSPERFSLSAAFDQSERQLVSAGTFFLTASARIRRMTAPGPILPADVQASFGQDGSLSSFSSWSAGAGAGYAYTYVSGTFFVSGLLSAGLGWQVTDYGTNAGAFTQSSLSPLATGLFSVGWNDEAFYGGVSGFASAQTLGTSSIEILDTIVGARAFFGYRFGD